MTFHKVLSEQLQTLRLSTLVGVDNWNSALFHYENTSIQMYRKFYLQNPELFR